MSGAASREDASSEAAARERVSAAKLWLTAVEKGDAPYLSAALSAMPTIVTTEVATISVDDLWRLYVNPDWVCTADVPVLAAHISHLVWHLLRDHAERARSMDVGRRESETWTTAADLTVSRTLDVSGHALAGLARPGDHHVPADLAVEQYYALLHRLDLEPDGGGGAGDDEGALSPCGSGADGLRRAHDVAPEAAPGIDGVRGAELRRQIAVEFSGHLQKRGTQPGEWARWVEQILDPKVPWQQVLTASVRRAVAWTHGNTHATYRRLSRRQAASPLAILPGSQRAVPAVAIVIDTSGSMDDGLLAQALGEVDGVLRALGTAVGGVNVLSCDAAVHTTERVTSARRLSLVGGGGTDLRHGIDAALALKPRPEILIVLTDGDTPWPAAAPARCTVIAVLIARGASPHCPAWAVPVLCLAS
jgi:predicted metal-dependent peptidase